PVGVVVRRVGLAPAVGLVGRTLDLDLVLDAVPVRVGLHRVGDPQPDDVRLALGGGDPLADPLALDLPVVAQTVAVGVAGAGVGSDLADLLAVGLGLGHHLLGQLDALDLGAVGQPVTVGVPPQRVGPAG